MNMNVLQNVTPIKLKDENAAADSSFTSIDSHCSYFNITEWNENDGSESGNMFSTPSRNTTPQHQVFQSLTPHKTEARKVLFSEAKFPSVKTKAIEKDCKLPAMQKDAEDFGDVWKFSQEEISQPPVYTFTDNSAGFQNTLRVDVLSEFQEFASNPDPTQRGDALTQLTQASGYPCASYQSNNGILRTYSNDINQQISQQQTSMPNLTNHPIGMHHMTYQSTSPNTVDANNSAHNSPFTASPSQGFEYPTSPHVKPSIPPNTDYPGDYNFSINFGEATESAPKSAQYTFSHPLNKLFVKMNVTCPIRFRCDNTPPMGCTIRAIPVFKRPEHVTDVVTRCPNHKIPDEANFVQCGHLIRAEMPDELVRYNVAPDLRESVSVRYERPQIGAEYTTILFKFMCLSSCVGGINRRPLLTVFVLENPEGQVLGRRVVEVRICSCPGRDRAQEEKRKFNEASGATSNGHDKSLKRTYKNVQTSMEINQTVSGKKRRATPSNGDQEEFVLKIRGRDKFMMLKRVKEALDLMEYVTPQQQEAYRNKEDQDQALFRQRLATDSSSTQLAAHIHSNKDSSSAPLSSIFTVSEPLSTDAASASIDGLTCPSHSSHPLTATPTGVTNPGDDCPVSGSFHDPTSDPHYWTVDGSHIGCDIPDTSDPLRAMPSTSSWGNPQQSMRTPRKTPHCLPMTRESSGTSTVSVSSSGSSNETVSGRYVTRVLLRQTLSLDRNGRSLQELETVEPNDDFTWENMVKTESEKNDQTSPP